MYVKADFEPIVSEEDWHKCEAIRKRRRKGFCDMQMVADWKLEVMCKRLMEEIWQDRSEAIQEACIILKKCYQANMDKKTESITTQKKVMKIKKRLITRLI